MRVGRNDRVREVRPEATDTYWDNLVRGLHAYGSDAEVRALNDVMHNLRHAELHPKERPARQIGHGKGRHLPRRYKEAAN